MPIWEFSFHFDLRNQAIWWKYPWLLLLSFVMLMILVLWILCEIKYHVSQNHLRLQLDLCIFGALSPIQHFSNDRCHLWGEMNFCAICPCFIDHLFLTSDFRQIQHRNSPIFPFLVHCCCCCGNFHGLRHRNKISEPNCNAVVSSLLSLQFGLHDESAMILPFAVSYIHITSFEDTHTQILFWSH